ncbi:MAG: DUF2634 domain-containing protein [Lachnospiraceae bacterium]|jgi:hypothetical protein|nr:DUF2634 domain-containing protein [Lachnospiraceae bacterium]
MAALPEGVGFDTSLQHEEKPTNTFIIDWSARQISGMDSGLEAMKQAVDIILQNERFEWQIYTANFGSELTELVGEEYDFIVSDLPRRIEDAFSVDKRITAVEDFVFSPSGTDHIICRFNVITVFGTFAKEVSL